jgi:hypothetical protein
MQDSQRKAMAIIATEHEKQLMWGGRFNKCSICGQTAIKGGPIDGTCIPCKDTALRMLMLKVNAKFVE